MGLTVMVMVRAGGVLMVMLTDRSVAAMESLLTISVVGERQSWSGVWVS